MKLTIESIGALDLRVEFQSLTPEHVARAAIAFVGGLMEQDAIGCATPKTEWNIILEDVGDRKIEVIKAIRTVWNWDLKTSKDATERGRTVLGVEKDAVAAHKAVQELRSAGATATLEPRVS